MKQLPQCADCEFRVSNCTYYRTEYGEKESHGYVNATERTVKVTNAPGCEYYDEAEAFAIMDRCPKEVEDDLQRNR